MLLENNKQKILCINSYENKFGLVFYNVRNRIRIYSTIQSI